MRVIIEKNGGDGKAVKANIDTNYQRGLVHWSDNRVGELVEAEQRMVLKGAAMKYQSDFDELLK